MLKAAREAKVNTSWISPNIPYEEALLKFVDEILSSPENSPFLKDFGTFQKKISFYGMFNSLSQTLLKMTSPGIPDCYQGTEIWNFSLVDPDNRGQVDYDIRKEMLMTLKKKIAMSGPDLTNFARNLLQEWRDGFIKLYLTFKTLNYRKENHPLFLDGTYIPLMGDGDLKEHICAFVRQREEKVVLVVVPRFLTHLIDTDEMPFGTEVWKESRIMLSDKIDGDKFHNIFTGETIQRVDQNGQKALALGEIFAHFPVAMLERVEEER